MPEQLHPPYAPGAITLPRELLRWLDINSQNGKLNRIRKFIIIPSFNVVFNYTVGFSYIVAEFHYEAPNNFSFRPDIIALPKSKSLNFSICVSFVNSDNTVVRYRLFTGSNEQIRDYIPQYVGQLIKKNFRIEIWCDSVSVSAVLTNPIIIYTTLLGDYDYRFQLDTLLVGADGICVSQAQLIGAGGITADNTILTADMTVMTADNSLQSGFPVPLVWGACADPVLNN